MKPQTGETSEEVGSMITDELRLLFNFEAGRLINRRIDVIPIKE